MPSPLQLRPTVLHLLALVAFALAPCAASAGEPAGGMESDRQTIMSRPKASLASFLDRLPELSDQGLPGFAPQGALKLYLRPRLGDFFHENYFRLPVGARLKIKEHVELNTELGSYFTHGLRDSVGYGFYQFRFGVKREEVLSPDTGLSYGIDYTTPLSRPPIDITDGLRHTLPYVTVTQSLLPNVGLVGFATFGADLIDYTPLTVNFSENQLRANSLILTLGLAREWRRMHVILRVFDGNTAPLSKISENVFGFRPSIGVPFLRRRDGTPRFTATFEGRAIWGPDGFETGVATRVRFDLRYRAIKKP